MRKVTKECDTFHSTMWRLVRRFQDEAVQNEDTRQTIPGHSGACHRRGLRVELSCHCAGWRRPFRVDLLKCCGVWFSECFVKFSSQYTHFVKRYNIFSA